MDEQKFGYGYLVTGDDGVERRAIALHADQPIEILVKTKNIPCGTERYYGPAGKLWMWCRERGVDCKMYSLVAVPNGLVTGAGTASAGLPG